MVHCKAHRTKEQIKKLDLQGNNDVAGNVVADRWAKEGASMDRGYGTEMALHVEMANVEQAATMILERYASVDSNWNDLCPKAEWQAAQNKKKGQRGGGLVVSKEGMLRHSSQPYCNLEGQQIGRSCDRCRAWTKKPQALERWARTPCNAQKWVKWGMQARQHLWLVQGHPIMKAGPLLWCLRCGKYTEPSLKRVKIEVRGEAS